METTSITPAELKANDNFLCSLELPNSLRVYLTYQGTGTLIYRAFLNEQLLFDGNDFKPSPLHSIDTIESCIELLAFLSTRPGDTDDEYFAKYTPAQLTWCKSFACETLSNLISDYEDKDSEYNTVAKEYFEPHFKTA